MGASAKFQTGPRRSLTPTLTRTRGAQRGWWLTKLNRRMQPREMLRLQGLPGVIDELAGSLKLGKNVVGGAAGNAWPVNVVASLVRQIAKSMQW